MEREHENATLQSPLIQDGFVADVKQNESSGGIERREIVEEVKKQLWLSGPLISVTLLNFCLQVISVMFVGHLGNLALSGASMATSFASVTGFSLLVGMASALDTLCGQSYGAKQHRMLGIHMQRAMFILMIVSIPLAIIWINTRSILIFLGQDPEISAEAGKYAQLMVPNLFAYGLLQCLNRFLQTQNNVFPMMFSSGVTTLLHFLICWLMVYKSGLGSRGAAIANAISYWLNVSILSLYVKFSPSCAKTWTGFSKEALHNIPSFLRLAIPSALMVCLEMWSFEMMVLLSGLLPNPKLETSVLSICLNTSALVWMIPFGLSGAVSTRVSNELGAGHACTARLAVCVVLVIAIIESIVVGTVMIVVRNIWGYAYSNDVEVVKYVATMLPILATSNFLDGLQCVLSGTARGCGWQKIGAFVNLGSYYLVGIPSAIVLAFVLHIGGKGLWLGIICALIVQVISLMIITIRTDWEQEAKKATDRVYCSITPESIVS
ncbi:protein DETOXIFICATION 16-like isoform X2 [Gastrolobium bilobum]|uniref:protein DETOXIFICATION 16-like isoform X2 n=1 Tax=Gastrolobium bilobum TaxID=150636 RepID=UPI002AB27FAF|nr:protein DETOXIFICATION 16-like isoform X2 [Gastrolobium bilobum]